jgi:hypothetical protein
MDNKQVLSMLILGEPKTPSFDAIYTLSMRHRWFICIRLSDSYLTDQSAFSVSFTTSQLPD